MKNSVKYYLAAYNFIAFWAWLIYLILFIATNPDNLQLLLLNFAQGLAVLEILHAAIKWVKSPLGSTVAQVLSRLLVLVLIDIFWISGYYITMTPDFVKYPAAGMLIVSIAWSITEIIRYSFYFFNLFGKQFYPLLWMRYTFFIVLYPLGIIGEWLIITTPVVNNHFHISMYLVFTVFLLIVYVYYFPKLYDYMWRQRRERIK